MNKFIPNTPTIQMICDYIKYDQMTFDNPVQRGLVWNRKTKSLLIHSVLTGYPIQPIYANKVGAVYDIIDGQQRLTTFNEFINNKFVLVGVPEVLLKDGTKININGFKYKKLSKELQMEILTYTLILNYADSLSQQEVQETYIRLNNGKALTSTEMIKAQTLDVEEINKLAEHELFDFIMTKSSKNASSNISFVQQTYVVLFSETFCLRKNNVTTIMRSVKITEEQYTLLNKLFSFYLNIFKELKQYTSNKKAFKLLKKKIHFVSLISVIKYALEKNIDYKIVTNWILQFFSNDIEGTSNNSVYNDNLISATNEANSVKTRINVASEDFKNYLVKNQ